MIAIADNDLFTFDCMRIAPSTIEHWLWMSPLNMTLL